MIKRFSSLFAALSKKMNTVQCLPVKYDASVVYNKDSQSIKGNYLQMGLIKRLKL